MNIERILIIFLLITTIVFGYMWVFRKPQIVDNKDEINRLENEIKKSEDKIKQLNKELVVLYDIDNKYQMTIDSLKTDIQNYSEKSLKTTQELKELREKSKAYQREIEELSKKEPKQGDDLINSLKNKFK